MSTQTKNQFVRFFLGLLLLSLFACAKSPTPEVPEVPPAPEKVEPEVKPEKTEAEIIWEKYVSSASNEMQPFRTQLTLRYGTEGKTDRASALLWGNDEKEIRLDIGASVGLTVAKIYEGPRQFILFTPQEKKAYRFVGDEKPLFTVGVPMPLGLSHLTLLLSGHTAKVFGEQNTAALTPEEAKIPKDIREELPKKAKAYTLTDNAFAGTLVLDEQGLPLYWSAEGGKGWTIEFNYKEKQKLPFRLKIVHADTKQRALLLIKEREKDIKTFTGVKLKLILPKNTPVVPLEEFGKKKKEE